ncbi:Protein bli-3 [Fusarium culmorum]|uniref:Protein bli-3 n=3 Tax=Fusarium sambucinum species complex TaxID=569360 RepID=A0A2T4GD30_FUSCU|nr:Protein bli-3 [Fusarium culmorum]
MKSVARPRRCYITLPVQLQASRSGSDLIFNHKQQHNSIRFFTTTPNKMSFSNANTGDAPADPYKKANTEDVPLQTKIEDLVHFITKEKFGMMTTRGSESGNLVSRCMALAATETGGIDLLFHTNTESGKTDDLDADPHVNISFINASGEWASIAGNASISTDRSLVAKHYSPTLKAWLGDLGDGVHDGSEKDPRIGIIRVKAVSSTYSLVSKNLLSRVADIASSTVTGKPASPNTLREISEGDVRSWRASRE